MPSVISNLDSVWIISNYKHILRSKSNMIWFSSKEIEDLYKYLKENGRSGVRVYRGKYPNHKRFENVNGAYDYRNEKTIVFIPTIYDGTKHNDEITVEEVKKHMKEIEDGIPEGLVGFNHGELCPPNCDGDNIENNTD